MIQRLRWKFVAIIMTVVTLLLAAICSFLFVTVRGSLQEDSISVLRRVITQKGESVVMWDPDSGGILSINPFREQEVSLPYFTVAVNHQGQAAVLDSKFYNLNDEEALLQVVQAGLDAQSDIGVLANYKLRYLRKTTTSGWRIAFTDMTQEISTTRNLLRNLLLIGGSALVGFFFISLLLARWATRPAERAWKQQRQFVADASHELKTPLTVVLSNVDMLQEYSVQPQDARQQRWLGNIRASSEQMKDLVEEMLTLARSDAGGQQALVHQQVNFSDLVDDALLRFEPAVFEAGKQLEDAVTEELYVTGDGGKLKRLVDILLDNARKYTPEGGHIWVTLVADGRNRIQLTVRNEGTPIPAQDLEHIFEPFAQEFNSARSSFGGTGLGMPIAKSLVETMGGNIEFESEKNVGTTFRLKIPFKIDDCVHIEEPTEEEHNVSIEGVRVLVAEDNDLNMEITEFVLSSVGAVVIKASNGQEAIEIFEKSEVGEIDIILMDVMMPGVDGLAATRIIRSMSREDAKTIPIIAMTANAFSEDRLRAVEAGMNEHLAKPLESTVIIKTIAKYLKEE